KQLFNHETFVVDSKILSGFELYDPQKCLTKISVGKNFLSAKFVKKRGNTTFFIKTTQGSFTWWQPIDIYVIDPTAVLGFKPIIGKVSFEKIELTSFFN